MKRTNTIPWAALPIFGLLALYVGSYTLIVHPASGPTIEGRVEYGDKFSLEPEFRIGDRDFVEMIYSPLLRIDRRLRASVWTYTVTNHSRAGTLDLQRMEAEAMQNAPTNMQGKR